MASTEAHEKSTKMLMNLLMIQLGLPIGLESNWSHRHPPDAQEKARAGLKTGASPLNGTGKAWDDFQPSCLLP